MTVSTAARAAAGAAGVRHHVAILFYDLKNSSQIAELLEVERYRDLLNRLHRRLEGIVEHHGGLVSQIEGDGAMCLFGYPQNHEDYVRRATEAAMDIHAAAASLDARLPAIAGPLRLHSGIDAGMVLVCEGDMVRGRYELRGPATNAAKHLSDLAGSDEILVSEAALGADRHFFRLGPRRQLCVSSASKSVAVVDVQGREPVQTRFAARAGQGMTPFTGRAAELARLRAWIADGHRGVMLVAGSGGIGKTRLLGELLGEAEDAGVAVHRGYCEAYLAARPLQPFAQIMQSMRGAPTAESTDGADTEPDGSSLEQAIDGMRALIAGAGPCILAIDDWQWADDASREMLDALAPSAPQIGFLLASRDPDPRLKTAALAGKVEMPPLAPREAQAAIAALLPAPDPFLARRIGERAGGSPLFIEELCHAPVWGTGEIEGAQGHALLSMLIQARFADLPDEHARLVRAASVIGDRIPAPLFTAISGAEPDDPAVAALAQADFLFPDDAAPGLRFKHGFTREEVYRSIGLVEREALHKKAVAALEEQARDSGEAPLLDALAYHHGASGDIERAVPYAIRAGDAALAAGALDRAQDHYLAAFKAVVRDGEAGPHAGQIWRLVNKYGLACIVDPAPEQLVVFHDMAQRLQASGHAGARIRSDYWIGAIAYGVGESKLSVAHLTASAAAAARLGETRFLPQIEIKLAQSLFAAGRYDEADALFTRLLAAACTPGTMDRETRVYALCCHGFLNADQGDFASAERLYAEADLVRGSAAAPLVPSYLTQKSAMCLMRGEWHEALDQAVLCIDACARTRARYQAMMSKALGAYASWQIDRDPTAIETLLGAARWFASGASRQRTSLVHGWLADIMAEIGDAAATRRHAADAAARVRRAGDRLGEAMAYRAVARVAARQGDGDRAGRYLASAYRSAAIRGSRREEAQTRLCEAELAIEAGEGDRAGPLLGQAETAFTTMGMPVFAARARALRATSR